MTQQSTTQPRPAPKRQGKITREQNQRIAKGQENTKGAEVPVPGETLKHADMRYPKPGPGNAYDISSGDRSPERGTHDRGDHDKTRADRD